MSERPTVHEQVFGQPAPPIDTEFGRVSMERAVDGLWGRPGLERRDRRLLTLAVLAGASNDAALDAHLDGALRSGDLTAAELEEAAVHLAHYAGWPVGARLAAAVGAATERFRRAWPVERPVGVVGVGALGGDVGRALVAAGAEVLVHDARTAVAAAIDGATAVDDLAALAEACAVISIVVRDDAQVLDVMSTVAGTARPGTVVLVHSTVSIETVRRAEELARGAGSSLLDVGLCRPSGMDSGLVALVGGHEEPATATAVDAVLHGIARHVHRLGPLGSGMLVKALRNAVLYGAYAGVSEATDVCERAGIDVDELIAALRDSGASGPAALAFLGYRAAWQRGEHAGTDERAGFVDLARKDLGVAREEAAAAGFDASFVAAVAEAMPAAYLVER